MTTSNDIEDTNHGTNKADHFSLPDADLGWILIDDTESESEYVVFVPDSNIHDPSTTEDAVNTMREDRSLSDFEDISESEIGGPKKSLDGFQQIEIADACDEDGITSESSFDGSDKLSTSVPHKADDIEIQEHDGGQEYQRQMAGLYTQDPIIRLIILAEIMEVAAKSSESDVGAATHNPAEDLPADSDCESQT